MSSELTAAERMFPIMTQKGASPHPMSVPWSIAELAYSVYAAEFGKGQSIERLAERGGFGAKEMDTLLPDWRERCSEIAKLTAENAALKANDRTSWEVCHELMECGHPRACWQDRNYPASEQNYNPETKTGEPPLDYRCVACEQNAALREQNAELVAACKSIFVRVTEGDKRCDWLPTIANIAQAAIAKNEGNPT